MISWRNFNIWFARMTFSSEARADLYDSLADILMAGQPIRGAISEVRRQCVREGRRDSDTIFIILDDIKQKLERGAKFSGAIKNWIPTIEYFLIDSNEEAGKGVEAGLRAANRFVLSSGNLRSIWISALIYPFGLFVATMALFYFYGLRVFPAFSAVISVDKWPALGRFVYFCAIGLVSYWWLFAIFLAVAVAASIYSLPRWHGKIRAIFDNIPPWSFYKMDVAVSFSSSLMSQFDSGEPIIKALENIEKNSDGYMKFHVKPIIEKMNKGISFGDALIDSGGKFPDVKLVSLFYLHDGKDSFSTSLPIQYERWVKGKEKKLRKIAAFVNLIGMVMAAIIIGTLFYAFLDISRTMGEVAGSVVH